MLKWLSPGDLVSDVIGLPEGGENRLILRMFINIIVYGGIATYLAFKIAT